MRSHKAEKSGNLERVLKEKENNKYENQIEVLWKVHTLGVKSSHLRCKLLEACSLEQTQRRVVDRT